MAARWPAGADINFAVWGVGEYEFAEDNGGSVSRDGGGDRGMGEIVFEGKFEVDANGGLTYAGEGDFGWGRVAGDDGRESGLVEPEVWFGS